ncbi:hypothetical protein F7U66_01315 [Vibrio parahaemolyticus]|nr:hypothetical protein [Vibrio parahaemolyticus]
MITHITTTERKYPISMLLKNQTAVFSKIHDDISIDEQTLASVVESALYGIFPMHFAVDGVPIELISGVNRIQHLMQFVGNKAPYPQNGILSEYRGLLFSEIQRKHQRKILQQELPINLYAQYSGNDGKEELYREFVKNLTR